MPAFKREATDFARAVEAAKAQDDKPNEQALAFVMASSSDEVGAKTHMMGPKISSCAILAVVGTCVGIESRAPHAIDATLSP